MRVIVATTPDRRQTAIHGTALLALFLKTQGAFWDVSYHFRHLRELTQSPHLLNAAGNLILLVLAVHLWRRTPVAERGPLRWMVSGIAVFLFAIPVDDRWHRLFGIDLAIWSPPHLLLYGGTALMTIGWILKVRVDADRRRITPAVRSVLLAGFAAMLFDCAWFLLLQHEHGVIIGRLMAAGQYHPDQDILAQYAAGKGRLYGIHPGLGYPLWGAFVLGVSAGLARAAGIRWLMTRTMGLYLAGRLLSYAFLTAVSYEVPAMPLFLLPCALCMEWACLRWNPSSPVWRAQLAGLLVLPMYLWSLLPFPTPFVPAFHVGTFPLAVLAAWAGLELAHAAVRRKNDLRTLTTGIAGRLPW